MMVTWKKKKIISSRAELSKGQSDVHEVGKSEKKKIFKYAIS